VLTKDDVSLLQEAAEWCQQLSQYAVARCIYLYRNKPKAYFDAIFSEQGDGIMKTYLKDASGDLRSPINGEIGGLFFPQMSDMVNPFLVHHMETRVYLYVLRKFLD